MSSSNLQRDRSPVKGHVSSPAFEEIKNDLKKFLSEKSRNHMDDLMEVYPETSCTTSIASKRPHPTSEDSDTMDSDTVRKSPRDSSKIIKKKAQAGTAADITSQEIESVDVSNTVKTGTGKKQTETNIQGAKANTSRIEMGSMPFMELPKKYEAFLRGPYVLHCRMPLNQQQKKSNSIIGMSKKLVSANVKFTAITRYGPNTWKITCPSKAAANSALINKYVSEAGISLFIPGYKLSRKLIVRGIPLDETLEDLKKAIEEENQSIMVVKIFRLKRKNRALNKWVDSESICIQILGEALPEEIIIYKTINETFPYIPSVRICYNCGYFGHLSKFCEREPKCLSCGGPRHESTSCTGEKRCINCKGEHATTDRSCPLFKRHAEIARVMAEDNLPYFEAKSLVIKGEKKCLSVAPPTKTLKNFPVLPEKKNARLINTPAEYQVTGTVNRKLWSSLTRDCGKEERTHIAAVLDRILEAEDMETLITRINHTIDLHNKVSV